jgi:N-acetylmuramoyl-L-alanine amidase
LTQSRFFRRWRIALALILFLAGFYQPGSKADPTEEEKKQLFLKAREQMRTVASPTPEASATPRPKPKPAQHPPKKKKSPTPSPTEAEEETQQSSLGKSSPTITPLATPNESTPHPQSSPNEPGQIVVEKSGYQKPRGFSLLPFHLFATHYNYLTRSVRSAIDRAPVLRERWRFIIVHNSGTRQGNARIFDYYHRNVRRMPNGLAYHFVIGNGTSSGDGEIEVGDRWRRQINGGHVHSDYLNNISLGICLVGDFNRDQPTRAQLASAEELIRYLRARCGKVEGKNIPVRPHREMNPPRWPTDCPGDAFPYRWFRIFD